MTQKIMRIYAAGGAGTNIGSLLENKYARHKENGFAEIHTSYIDTSRSNISDKIPNDAVYLLKDLDGSGKVRAENYPQILGASKDIILKHAPGDVNIVLSSLGGGSGSVIAPVLTGELLAEGCPTVVIAIGSKQTKLDAENTLKTLKSYDGIARKNNTPVVMFYVENGTNGSRGSVDQQVVDVITALAVLFSGENAEMDSQDLKNWLNFTKVSSYQAGLASLVVLDDGKEYDEDMGEIITAASLAVKDGDESIPGLTVIPGCQYTGFLPETIVEWVVKASPLHFLTTHGPLVSKARELEAFLAQQEKVQASRIAKGAVALRNEGDDNGMVL